MDSDWQRAQLFLNRLPFPFVQAAGWTAFAAVLVLLALSFVFALAVGGMCAGHRDVTESVDYAERMAREVRES